MIKIASISNNYGKTYDGVGAFAKVQNTNFPKWVKCVNYTAVCTYEISKIHRFLDLGMFKEIWRLYFEFEIAEYDAVVIEYPFVEWNPLILFPLFKLSRKIRKNRKKFVLSLHEYKRVNILRKKIIEYMCKWADLVFVADDKMAESILGISKKVVVRPIPTNLYMENYVETIKKRNCYVYFGLVNHSKAFDELINSWDIYNKDNKKTLYVLTATPLENIETHVGVKYLYNKQEDEILKIMRGCACCFIPVLPEIDMKNTTFKTASITGCICIGKFCDEYKKLPFIINMKGYEIHDFQKALMLFDKLSDEDVDTMYRAALKFGEQYLPQRTAIEVAENIKCLIQE